MTRAPLPEMGRRRARGMISRGICSSDATGATPVCKSSSAPDALNIPTAVISPTREGSTRKITLAFSPAPSIKASKTGTFCEMP